MTLLKILYWTTVAVDLLLLLGVASAAKPGTTKDVWVMGAILVFALLYLGGSSVLFLRSISTQWRLSALALVVLAPALVFLYGIYVVYGPNMRR